jgi:hypothetical protein
MQNMVFDNLKRELKMKDFLYLKYPNCLLDWMSSKEYLKDEPLERKQRT